MTQNMIPMVTFPRRELLKAVLPEPCETAFVTTHGKAIPKNRPAIESMAMIIPNKPYSFGGSSQLVVT